MILEIPDSAINDLQKTSFWQVVARARGAHFTDIRLRIDGRWESYQADWLKHIRILPKGNSDGN